jgi:hypothetical protein
MPLAELQNLVVAWLDRGASLGEIEAELTDGVRWLAEDERAALWLLVWSVAATDSCRDRRGRVMSAG